MKTVAHHSDRPEEMRIETEKCHQQSKGEPTSYRSATERTGTERVAHDQVALTGDRDDQPDWIVANLYTHNMQVTNEELYTKVQPKRNLLQSPGCDTKEIATVWTTMQYCWSVEFSVGHLCYC